MRKEADLLDYLSPMYDLLSLECVAQKGVTLSSPITPQFIPAKDTPAHRGPISCLHDKGMGRAGVCEHLPSPGKGLVTIVPR